MNYHLGPDLFLCTIRIFLMPLLIKLFYKYSNLSLVYAHCVDKKCIKKREIVKI